jgi:cobalt-zinc-cadmium efflux system outer membrane protein
MRRFILLLYFALPLTASAQALTEAEALRLGFARSEFAAFERSTRAVAEADAAMAGLWPNPTLSYNRERMRGAPGSVDETWQIAQTFDLSGRRGLRLEAAERRVDAAVAGSAVRRADLVAEIRRRFYEVLLEQQTVLAMETWAQRFTRVETIVGKLARAGEASGYDRRRLVRERQAAQARLATERATLDRNRERLAALLGKAGRLDGNWVGHLVGHLLPAPLPTLEATLATLDRRPDLLILAHRAEAADLEGRAASRGWAPDVTLGVGSKRSNNNNGNGITRDHGTVFTLSIPLPVFDRQQAGEQRAAAEAINARAEYGLARSRAEGDLRGLHRQTERLILAAEEYRANAAAAAPDLLHIAEAAYQGGESTLLELLDAYRGALEAETTALDLEWKAREARIDYDLLTESVTE